MQLQEAQLQKRIKVGRRSISGRRSIPDPSTASGCSSSSASRDKRQAWFMTLSGGQKQRLFIALALINDPELVFLDELTTGLDPQARRAIWDLVRGIRDRGKTVLLTTHLMEEAERLCDRVAIIDHGRIIDIDTPAALVARHCPGAHGSADDRDAEAEARFRALPNVANVGAQQDSRSRSAGRGDDLVTECDRLPVGEPHPRHRLPDRAADARGRVPEADGPFDSGLTATYAARTLETDLAGNQDLRARAARASRHRRHPGPGLRGVRALFGSRLSAPAPRVPGVRGHRAAGAGGAPDDA